MCPFESIKIYVELKIAELRILKLEKHYIITNLLQLSKVLDRSLLDSNKVNQILGKLWYYCSIRNFARDFTLYCVYTVA